MVCPARAIVFMFNGFFLNVHHSGMTCRWWRRGDFAYNFDSDGGYLGDQFMRNIEQVAARVPYMVTHGNHEDSDANLAHYVERFRNMPSNAVPPTFATQAGVCPVNNMYFSWDAGLVHYISLSTEFWFGVESADGKVKTAQQLAWPVKSPRP